MRELVGFAGVAANAAGDDVLPGVFAAFVSRNDVVEIEQLVFEVLSAVLTTVFVAFEDVLPREFDVFLGKAVEELQDDDRGEAVCAADGVDDFHVSGVAGGVHPRVDVVGKEVRFFIRVDDLSVTEIQERERAFCRADIDRLPKPVQYEDGVI